MSAERLLDGRLKFRHLRMVDAISEHGTIVGAAAHLHVSQPVVTRALHELEELIGVALFERGPRGVQPTPFGEAFIAHARAAIAEVREAGRHLRELAEARRGEVTVGTHLAGANVLLPPAVLKLKSERPLSTVVVREGTADVLLADLNAGAIDLYVGRLSPQPEDSRLVQQVLYEDPILLATGSDHPAQAMGELSLQDLMEYPWVVPLSETMLRRELEAALARKGLALPVNRVECTSLPTLRHLLIEGQAVAVLPSLIIERSPGIVALPTPLEGVRLTVGVMMANGRTLRPTVEFFLDKLREVAADLSIFGPGAGPSDDVDDE